MLNAGRTRVARGMAVFILAGAVLAWSGYYGFQTISAHRPVSDPEATDAQHEFSQGPDREYDVTQIIDAHLFGEVTEPVEEQTAAAPETNLQIRLLGLVASANPSLSRAIIDVDGAKLKPYSVGESIEGTDAVIHAVENSRVLLKRGQALESLALKRKGTADASGENNVTPVSTGNAGPSAESSQQNEATRTQAVREKLENNQMKQPF